MRLIVVKEKTMFSLLKALYVVHIEILFNDSRDQGLCAWKGIVFYPDKVSRDS